MKTQEKFKKEEKLNLKLIKREWSESIKKLGFTKRNYKYKSLGKFQ